MNNYNIDPYFDDFDPKKNYVKVMFKPGVPVQARELTQMQSAIQQQIRSIGGFLFKNESLVLGGESQSFNVIYTDVLSVDLSLYVNKNFVSDVNGSKIRVIYYKNNISPGISRLYFSYLNGNRLDISEVLTEDTVSPSVPSITITNKTDNLGIAKAFKLLESVFYIKDYFVVAPEQTIVLGDTGYPTAKVGLRVTEEITTYQDDDTLLDPSSGTNNYAAPGADRIQISLDLIVTSYDPISESNAENMVENTEDNFIELARFNRGILVKSLKDPSLGALEDIIARRTYDESGDYTVRPFRAKATKSVKKDPSKLSIAIEPGKAYVKGYEFETTSTINVDLEKARNYDSEQNVVLQAGYGDYFVIDTISGLIAYNQNDQIDLKDTGVTIGTAKIIYVKGIDATKVRLYVSDVLITNPAKSIQDVTDLGDGVWSANVDATGNSQVLYRGKRKHILIPFSDSPIKRVYDTSYISQTSIDGTGTGSSVALTLTGNDKSFVSGDALDYVAFDSGTGTRVNVTSVDVTSDTTVTLQGSFTLSTTYTVYAKVSINSQLKTKTRTKQTIYIANSNSEKVSLGIADVYKINKITAINGTNQNTAVDVTGRYSLDNGQTDYLYDYSSIVLKRNSLPVSTDDCDILIVDLDYLDHETFSGYFSLNSYDLFNTNDAEVVPYETIPSYKSNSGQIISLRDVIDFRPRRSNSSGFPGAEGAPFTVTLNPVIQGSEICEPGQYVTTDYDYYTSRIDKLIITKEKRFDLIRGVPSKQPSVPTDLPDAMTIYNVTIPAYTFSANEVRLDYIENKRYTMRDIGKIDNRVSRVEYYTAMSLIEKQASDETITNASGIDKFKNGILVDSFAGHSVGDVGSADYSCAIDSLSRSLRPKFSKQNIEFDLNKSETSDLSYSLNEHLITVPYSTEVKINNSQPTQWTDIQRYSTFAWAGEVRLNPSSDTWSDTHTLPDVITNLNGDNDAYTILADQVSNPSSTGVKWADWQLVDKGIDTTTVVDSIDTRSETSGSIETTFTTTTSTTTTTENNLYYQSGIQIQRAPISTITRDLGSKVVDASIIPFIRQRIVDFEAFNLQPNTQVFASFDGVDVTRRCTQAPAIYVQAPIGATRVRKSGDVNKAGDIILLRTNKVFVKMDAGQYLFVVGDNVEWLVDNSWVPGSAISQIQYADSDTLLTDEAGDIAGYFTLPGGTFRTGERVFRIADILGNRANTAAESKYVAMGLAMSLQSNIIATRVQTVSVNPIAGTNSESNVTSSTNRNTTSFTTEIPVEDEIIDNSTVVLPPPPPEVPAVQPLPVVVCGDTAGGSGRTGRFTYAIEYGTDIGECGINFKSQGIPDRYTIIWNGREYSSGFVGDASYNSQLTSRGYPVVNTSGDGKLRFTKTAQFPTEAQLIVDAPLEGTDWQWKVVCPGSVDDMTPETTAALNVTVDTPATISLTFDGFATPSFRSEILELDTILDGPSSASYNFTIRVDGNQNVPDGTPVTVTSLTRTETNNGRYNSFSTGTTFRKDGQIVSQFDMLVGETVTLNASYDLTEMAQEFATTNNGTLRAPSCSIAASVQLKTALDGSLAAATGSDSTTVTSAILWTPQQDTRRLREGDLTGCRADPLAQTFFVSSRENPDGIFVDSVDIFFRNKSDVDDAPVTVSIRPTVNGYPSSTEVMPFATSTKYSREIETSAAEETSKKATNFKFQAPVYLSTDAEYAIVVASPVTGFQVYISQIGEFLLGSENVRATKQPLAGSMFYSSTGTTWTPEQTQDMCLRIRKCVFSTNSANPIVLNAKLTAAQQQSDRIDYDLLFIDGEILDFSSTNVDYFYRSSVVSGSTFSKESVWNPYQLGSNLEMKNRKSIDPKDTTSLKMRCILTTRNSDVSPVIDLSRLSGTVVQNVVNDNSNSEDKTDLYNITNVVATTTSVTVTTSVTHSITSGDYVLVAANTYNQISGYRVVTGVTSNTFTFAWVGSAISSAAETGTVTRKNQSLSRYITRKVSLNSEFYSDDIRVYYYAKIPPGCQVIPYYRVTSLNDPTLEDNDWVQMDLDTSGTPTRTGYVEYKYKPPYLFGGDSVALASGENYGTFSVKLVMLSSNPVKVPLVTDFRVLALSN